MVAGAVSQWRERGRRRNSLIFRIVSLCVLLVLFLLGVVYFLIGHYYREMVREMQARAAEIAGDMQIWLDEHPDLPIDWNAPPDELTDLEGVVSLRFQEIGSTPPSPTLEPVREDGAVYEAMHFLERDGSIIELRARITLQPQTEILRAFKNRYLLSLTIAFLVTLVLLILVISRALRPLQNLARSCANISKGRLEPIDMKGSTTEIRSLEQTFNRMVQSLAEKELVETNLRQAQRLSAIGNLAAGVAHDVRNPLNAIKLLSSHAIDTLEDGAETTTAVKQLRKIRNEVDRLENIVSGFLSLAKEEELRLEPQPIDPLLNECLRLVKNDAEARHVNLHSDLRAGDRPLYIDAKKLTRAIIN
ncbi:MAG: histidine kinase dimerization/phospho-acceptor domain-containing protein, partial [Candidatus Hydrogenedentales bacterium]